MSQADCCLRCGRRHRTLDTWLGCHFHPLLWCVGRGRWACVARCSPGCTVQLYPTRTAAMQARQIIDEGGCCDSCQGLHSVERLPEHLRRATSRRGE
jgi:hypothetical protein